MDRAGFTLFEAIIECSGTQFDQGAIKVL